MNKHPYRRIIPLIQHTPMIHFQADQAGATLRATEVKPKLARFLREELPDELKDQYGQWISTKYIPDPTSGKHTNSGYQMHITARPRDWYVPVALMSSKSREPARRALNQLYPQANGNIQFLEKGPYFANADKIKDELWDQVRLAVMYSDVEIHLKSKHPGLLDFLEAALPHFLLRHNFGTRNNKGFGCFLPVKVDKRLLESLSHFHFTVSPRDQRDGKAFDSLFKDLNLFYNTLRSGINVPDRNGGTTFYFKSLLFLYFKQKGIQWDKKSIKQTYFHNQDNQHKGPHGTDPDMPIGYESEDKRLVRDLMGLASDQKWGRDYRNASVSKAHQPSESQGENSAKIARAASPIFFKPIRSADRRSFEVYIGYRNLSSVYLGEAFKIQVNGSGNLRLSLPESFDIEDFLRFAANVDLRDHVDARFWSTSEYQTLEDIFQQLSENQYA